MTNFLIPVNCEIARDQETLIPTNRIPANFVSTRSTSTLYDFHAVDTLHSSFWQDKQIDSGRPKAQITLGALKAIPWESCSMFGELLNVGKTVHQYISFEA
jgi:hypothetical protein